MARPRLFLIDAFNFIFRAFHARQRTGAPPMRTSRGSSTEAVYIFHNMLRRIQKVYHPEYLAVVYESEGPTFRDHEFAAYKANRSETPPELIEQIPVIENLMAAMRIPVLKLAGFEADDLIGAVAKRPADVDVVIVSSDKDMLQLVDDRISMLNPMKDDTLYDPAMVEEFMGVPPRLVADLLALKGDAVDNIPGAPGIGDKGARDLVAEYGAVEAVLENAALVQRKAYRESLQNNRDQILLSKRLATIDCNAPLDFTLDALAAAPPDREALAAIYKDLEFFSFLKDLAPADSAPVHQDLALSSPKEIEAWARAVPAAAPVALSWEPGALALCAGETETVTLPWEERDALSPLFANPKREFFVFDWKSILASGDPPPVRGPIDDVLLRGFLALADPSAADLDSLATRFLGHKPAPTAAARAAAIFALSARLKQETDGDLGRVYRDIDLPLAPVLAAMESAGIRIDTAILGDLSIQMDAEIQRLTASIFDLAKHPFNINSPQQLGKVLFEELLIPAQGKTGKTKNYSTAADVLEALAPEHAIASQVLEFRQLTKLKGTYVDALPALIRPSTGRLHTTFNPAGAATGRLSSSNPNLQNIPIRTELGRSIRAAFVPEPGWTMLVADYSQIELRLLAHFSGDKLLTEAFRNGEDIHTRTAAEVFGVPPLMVTPDLRRNAKAVNFGIVYGQTPFGLAAQLGIPREEAARYIDSYFARYSGVKKWIDATIAQVRKSGHTVTLHGRRRAIPDINSKNPNARSFAERTAVNTPLQGAAADLIKIAMIRIHSQLLERKMQSRMLLQVHDELVLEAPPSEAAAASALVKQEMENVARLAVPLLADTGAGSNWRDAK